MKARTTKLYERTLFYAMLAGRNSHRACSASKEPNRGPGTMRSATAGIGSPALELLEQETIAPVKWRLIPLLFLCYYAAYLDRVNVGFAALHMNTAPGLTAAAFGLGGGIFFVGYVLAEIPSNLILERVGARVWIARILLTWGVISALTAFVWNDWSRKISVAARPTRAVVSHAVSSTG